MRYKNLFLIVVSLLVLVAVSKSGEAMIANFSTNITEVKAITTGGARESLVSNVWYVNNGTYFINMTIESTNSTHNLTAINITISRPFQWAGGNWSGKAGGGLRFSNDLTNLSNTLTNRSTRIALHPPDACGSYCASPREPTVIATWVAQYRIRRYGQICSPFTSISSTG